jgi:hypothetical protein
MSISFGHLPCRTFHMWMIRYFSRLPCSDIRSMCRNVNHI